MSYILDALKKSEQERGHGNIPDVQTVHSSSLNYRSEKRSYWPYILIAAVLLNLLAIIYFTINKENPAEIKTTTQQPNVAEQTKIESTITLDKTEKPNNTTAAVSNNNKNVEIKETEVESAVETTATTIDKTIQPADKTEIIVTDTGRQTTSSKKDIIEFYELPESIKQELPAIIISAHVYSTNPAQRSIVINNNFMEEGEYVLDGLILYEITTDGAIFNYQGTLFNYGVVSGWQ